MSITVGLIGLGSILPSHLAALKTAPEFAVASVCDAAPERAHRRGDELGCRAFTDWRELLQTPPDLAVVALPHWLHCDVCVAALRAGCHVLVEKPMAVSVAECNEMLRAAAECDRRLLVAEGASYDPGAVLTGRRLADGQLGAFFTGACINERFYFREGRPAWFLDPALSGGGMFINVGVHRLALARAALPGLTPVTVSASISHAPERPVEACTSLIVRYAEGGSMLYEEVGYYNRPDWLNVGRHFVFEQGIVAGDESLHRALCGTSNKPTLANFEYLASWIRSRPDPPLLVASTLLVPGNIDAVQVGKIAGFVARLSPDIPYVLLAFHPAFEMTDVPTTSREQADECLEAARSAGLTRIRIGNVHLLRRRSKG